MEDTKATTIRVQVGDYDCTYHLYQTKAPESYDGFGTMTLYVDGEERWVLISSEYVEWQTTRYASGMRSGRPSDDLHVTDLRRMLLARLFGEKEEG